MFSRRDMLAATAVGGVMTAATMTTADAATPVKSDISFGNPNDPPQGAINAKNPRSVSDPGPQNPAIRDQFPGAFSPPATDVGSMPLSWASFNNAPRRIQNGGWARQVTQDSFAVADIISGDLIARRRKLAECASTHRLLTMFAFRENAEVGGLIGWAARVADLSTRTALFVDPILKGARPPNCPSSSSRP